MEPGQLVTLLLGAAFGALGWLLVGLFMTRRGYERQAKNAARAVYFELDVDRISVQLARDHGVFQGLVRTSFDRLLPELATWLSAVELRTVAQAYMSHAGYEQVQRDAAIPTAVRAAVLARTADAHAAALGVLAARSFTAEERAAMAQAESIPASGAARQGADAHLGAG